MAPGRALLSGKGSGERELARPGPGAWGGSRRGEPRSRLGESLRGRGPPLEAGSRLRSDGSAPSGQNFDTCGTSVGTSGSWGEDSQGPESPGPSGPPGAENAGSRRQAPECPWLRRRGSLAFSGRASRGPRDPSSRLGAESELRSLPSRSCEGRDAGPRNQPSGDDSGGSSGVLAPPRRRLASRSSPRPKSRDRLAAGGEFPGEGRIGDSSRGPGPRGGGGRSWPMPRRGGPTQGGPRGSDASLRSGPLARDPGGCWEFEGKRPLARVCELGLGMGS